MLALKQRRRKAYQSCAFPSRKASKSGGPSQAIETFDTSDLRAGRSRFETCVHVLILRFVAIHFNVIVVSALSLYARPIFTIWTWLRSSPPNFRFVNLTLET